MAAALRQCLVEGLDRLGLPLAQPQVDQLFAYLGLIQKWNKVYNLTAVRDPGDMLTHHLLDSLAVIKPLKHQLDGQANVDFLDVGSGAGLPGVAIAICCPEIRVDCVDAVAKKAAFIQQAAAELRLPNLRGIHSRVQDLKHRYRVVACRAFASLVDFVTWSDSALASDGSWLAMKGKPPAAEMAELPASVEVFHVEQLEIPGLDAQRCLVWMKRRAA